MESSPKGAALASNFEVDVETSEESLRSAARKPRLEARASRRASRRTLTGGSSGSGRASSVFETARTFTEIFVDEVEDIILAPPPSATIASTSFTLLKNMLGSSVLAMPDGFKYASILPSLLILTLICCTTCALMIMIAVQCHKHGASSYRGLWSKLVGPGTAPLVDACICFNSMLSCVSYCLLIGAWMTQGLSSLFGDLFGSKALNSVVMAAFILFPLSLMRDLHALRHTAYAGMACLLFGTGFVIWQAALHGDERIMGRTCEGLYDPSLEIASHSLNYKSCTSSEVFSAGFWNPSMRMLATINMIASTFMAHYNVPKFYAEFGTRDPYVFARAVVIALSLGLIISACLSVAGVLRFGLTMPDANILHHFNEQFPGGHPAVMSNNERLVTLFTWCVMSLNIVASFPLLFSPLRTSLLQLCGTSVDALSPHSYIAVTAGLLSTTVGFGLIVPTLTVLTQLKGAIAGMSIAYIIPAIFLWKATEGDRSPFVVCLVVGVLGMGSGLASYGLSRVIQTMLKA